MNLTELDWRILLAAAGAGALALGAALYGWLHHAPDPEEIERRRRSRVNQIGRIAEGKITELVEAPAPPAKNSPRLFRSRLVPPAGRAAKTGRKLVWYTYSISGVTYETAQDVTDLEARVCLDRLAAGQPASVKYDPSNPVNSILVAEDWSGLR